MTTTNVIHYCNRDLHDDQQEPADYLVTVAFQDNHLIGTNPALPDAQYAACEAHMTEAFDWLAERNPDAELFVVRVVNQEVV